MHDHYGGYGGPSLRAFMALVSGALACLFLPFLQEARAAEKIMVGAVEDVVVFPWRMKVPARIDTGAATSSLDVCEYSVEGKFVTFTPADRCGGNEVRLPLAGWKNISSAEGSGRRPVVKLEICLGPKRFVTSVTLTDRSHMEFPFLVGRKTLRKDFVVDVSRTRIAPPSCPDVGAR